jgi:hypothetical protein
MFTAALYFGVIAGDIMATPFNVLGLVAVGALLLTAASSADPIHAIGPGGFQHHDSGWIFAKQIAGFVLVGTPQDVDGSRDAVAYYARTELARISHRDRERWALSRSSRAALEGNP